MSHPYGRVFNPSIWDLLGGKIKKWKAKHASDEKTDLDIKALTAEEEAKQKKEEMMGIYQEFVAFCESKGLDPWAATELAEAWEKCEKVKDSMQRLSRLGISETVKKPRKLYEADDDDV